MSTVPTLAELQQSAADFGLAGDSALKFINQQQEIAREERQKERELERERLQLAQTERDNARAHELEVARLQVNPAAAAHNPGGGPDSLDKPKLPTFKDGEDISSFIIRFERIAQLLAIPRDRWAMRLGTLLTGRALDIYVSFPEEVTSDFASLKEALLKGFRKTAEGYRTEFRGLRARPDETFEQFSHRLRRTLNRWLGSSSLPHASVEDLKDFFIADQLMAAVDPSLRTFAKEHKITSLANLTDLADLWATAHNKPLRSKEVKGPSNRPRAFESSKGTYNSPSSNSHRAPDRRLPKKSVTCYSCGLEGHVRANCPTNPAADSGRSVKVDFCLERPPDREYRTSGTLNGANVSSIVRDTGCQSVIVSEALLPDFIPPKTGGKLVTLIDYLGREDCFPVVRCYLRCPYFDGFVDAVRAPIKFCGVLVGNIAGVLNPFRDPQGAPQLVRTVPSGDERAECNAVTRSMARPSPLHPLVLSPTVTNLPSPGDFAQLQKDCPSLAEVRLRVASGELVKSSDKSEFKFVDKDGLIYRQCESARNPSFVGKLALVVPAACRNLVLKLAHEAPVSGHFSHRKTESKVRSFFFWPSISADLRTFCRSCDRCQRVSPKGRVARAPMVCTPIISEPFSRVSIDLVGPFSPPSQEGHTFILTLIDHATGFPEAIPLKSTTTIAVSEALLSIFSRVGFLKRSSLTGARNLFLP